MSDSSDPDFDRRLFLRVRREGPSEALRQRILLQGREELRRAELRRREIGPAQSKRSRRAPARSGRQRLRRASLGSLCACAALAGLLWFAGRDPERVSITAENTPPRSSEPSAPASEPARAAAPIAPPPEPPPVLRQSAAARASTAQRAAVRITQATPKSADAPAAPAVVGATRPSEPPAPPVLEAPPPVPAAPSLAEQVEHIKRARAALRAGEFERALLLLDEYQNGHAGELAAEARLLRIEALAQAGRKAEAASEARRFATDFPTSPLIDRAQSFTQP